ncbi:uncharacterized protein LOC110609569 isoform X2 [Manihot esculenta]|uniref:uncharacterized protein LOC110609569 isoform X2 n=1 Tax=Manihot esculenta TaxID=3983 RepID=UPI000B5D11A6|nr:uncharacterized protein LOC110609569 isoform X2 [Manihot esculenta]
MSNETLPPNSPGLAVLPTESIRSFLLSASKEPRLSHQLRDLASNLISQNHIHYGSLRSIWIASDPSTRPQLISLFSGSEFIFTSPKPREKSEELKARLRKLQELAEKNAYLELVKDITPRKVENEPFSSYKDQLGFAFRALFGHSPAMSAAGGILGIVCGMLVETLLFIIRTSNRDLKSSTATSTLKKNQ